MDELAEELKESGTVDKNPKDVSGDKREENGIQNWSPKQNISPIKYKV